MADSLIETSSSSSSDTVSTSSNTGVVVVGGDIVVGSGINSVNSAIPLPVDIQVDTTSNTRPLPPIVDEPILMMINSVNGEPESKRKKYNTSQESKSSPSMSSSQGANANFNKNLEDRLGGIICCAVCLDLPKFSMYQCQLGHLMCAACFTHLLADAKLRNLNATCPNCRIDLSRATASRNLAVEKIVSELQSECQYCAKEMIHKMVSRHEKECDRRPTKCGFARIGCDWKGPINEAKEHEAKCVHPQKSGAEVMAALKAGDAVIKKDQKILKTLIELLSYEQIIFNDLQMKPFRTDEYIHKLYYETKEFEAFHNSWIVTGRINNSQRDPHTVNDRNISYQLVLKSKTTTPLSVNFIALKGPFSDIKITTDIYKHEFTNDANESQYFCLPLPNSFECNRLLAAKAINFRLVMFLTK